MSKGRNIPKSDIPQMVRLLQTLSVAEVAAEWGTTPTSMSTFIRRFGYSVARIKYDFRVKYIKDNPTLSIKEFADIFKCNMGTVRVLVS